MATGTTLSKEPFRAHVIRALTGDRRETYHTLGAMLVQWNDRLQNAIPHAGARMDVLLSQVLRCRHEMKRSQSADCFLTYAGMQLGRSARLHGVSADSVALDHLNWDAECRGRKCHWCNVGVGFEAALGLLPEPERTALMLVHCWRFSEEHVAELANIGVNVVRKRLTSASNLLGAQVEKLLRTDVE